MMADEKIKNSNELEFAVFCIEMLRQLGVDTERVYQAFQKGRYSKRLYCTGI